jgi:hypothetical protein
MTPARHYVGLCGLAGVIFAVLTSALILFLEGFVTTSWSAVGTKHEGLWQICNSGGNPEASGVAWLISAQVFATLGLVGLLISFGLAVIYMTGNRASKNLTIVSLAAIAIISGVFMIVSIGVYGAYKPSDAHLSWSYYVTLISAILCLVGGILAIVQLRKSNVRL